jgi:TonB-dependent SusC/RagA subfamily outer membrane receptor
VYFSNTYRQEYLITELFAFLFFLVYLALSTNTHQNMKWHKILALIVAICLTQIVSGHADSKKSEKKITLSGLVKDDLNRPVAGALIFIDNKNTKIVTNDKGFYKVRVRPDAGTITIYNYPNGVSAEAINRRASIDFTLGRPSSSLQNYLDKSAIDNLVTLGYGNIDQNNLTSSVNKKNGQNSRYATYLNIFDILKETPGVSVTGGKINIRGYSSINLCIEPLFIVNGIPVSTLADISPQLIENITILKGASASIYGSRGTNGVILVKLID